MSAPGVPRTGTIHDQGYQAYAGARTAQHRRFAAIARNVLGTAWRQKWGVRLPVMLTGLVTVIFCVVIYLQRFAVARFADQAANPLLQADRIVMKAALSLGVIGFVLAVRVACTAIADDLRVGAFTFYFARSIRPIDYVLGKLLGVGLIVGIPMLGGPLVLAIFRTALCDSWAELASTIEIVPRAALYGLLATGAYALPALAAGALLKKRLPAQAAYGAYFFVVGGLAEAAAEELQSPSLRVIALHDAVAIVGRAIFGEAMRRDPSPVLAGIAVAAFGLVGALVVIRRVRRAELAGLGGGS